MMSHTPLVSIALCTYNGDAYLNQQLETLTGQSYHHLDIVIVDDRSKDSTIEIVNSFMAKDPRIKLYINKQNLGYVKNFEKAISLCTGDYIALADQDDIWELNKIETLINEMGDAVMIYHDSELINPDGDKLGKMSGIFNMYSGSCSLVFLYYNCVSGHCCLFNKSLVQKFGEFDDQFYHDWWIAYVAVSTGKIKYLDQPLVKYRQHAVASTDVLRLKKKPKSQAKYAELNIDWLNNCLRTDGGYNNLIRRIIFLYENKNTLNSLRLLKILVQHFSSLYYIPKKGLGNKVNYIRKIILSKRSNYRTIKN